MAKLQYDDFLMDGDGRYQPKTKNLWFVTFSEAGLAIDGSAGIQTFAIKSTGFPGGSHGDIELNYINMKYNFPGKWTWDEVEMKITDFIGVSSTKTLWDWWKTCIFNPESGKHGYGNKLKQDVKITLVSPVGEEIEEWTLRGAYPKSIKWGDGDYSSDDPIELSLTWKYDRAEHKTLDKPTGTDVSLIGDLSS